MPSIIIHLAIENRYSKRNWKKIIIS